MVWPFALVVLVSEAQGQLAEGKAVVGRGCYLLLIRSGKLTRSSLKVV